MMVVQCVFEILLFLGTYQRIQSHDYATDKVYIVVLCHVIFFKMHSYMLTNLESR